MSEKIPKEHEHQTTHRAAEIGAAGLGLAGVSATAYLVWRKRKAEARTFTDIVATPDLIFEEPRLKPEQRELMARLAARIYQATASSSNGVISRSALVEELRVKKHEAQKMLSFLMPVSPAEHEKARAFIDRRPGAVDGTEGYYATPRLFKVVEEGESDMLNQALYELLSTDRDFGSEEPLQ